MYKSRNSRSILDEHLHDFSIYIFVRIIRTLWTSQTPSSDMLKFRWPVSECFYLWRLCCILEAHRRRMAQEYFAPVAISKNRFFQENCSIVPKSHPIIFNNNWQTKTTFNTFPLIGLLSEMIFLCSSIDKFFQRQSGN